MAGTGFEIYRLIFCEYGPRAEGTDAVLLDHVMSMGKHTCNHFDETHTANKKFKKFVDKYDKARAQGTLPELCKHL